MNSTNTISCPSCQRTLRVPEDLLGHAVKCPSCSNTFTAPDAVEEAAPPRPTAPPQDDYEDEPTVSKRQRRRDDYDEDYDDVPRPRRRRRADKPGKVQAVAVMTLVGGILATLYAGLFMLTIYGFCWPGTYYSLVMGIMAIVRGSQLLGERAHEQVVPTGIATMQIVNVINCDFANLTLGIVGLIFLGDEEVKSYFRRG